VSVPAARPLTDEHDFDVMFADTCLGGSTVAARVGVSAAGVRGYYLADYAVNPLGVKPPSEIGAALDRWIRAATARTRTLVVACNTASVLLEQLPDLLARATTAGLRVYSMVHLLERVLAAAPIHGKRVCLMGTRFTVSQPVYVDRLLRAGAAEVLPLAATQTERTIAHLWHTSDDGQQQIEAEVGDTIRRSDVVVLACTLFPLIAPLLRELNPACVLVDPAAGIDGALMGVRSPGTNRLTIGVTGRALPLDEIRAQSGTLFPGWMIESVGAAKIDEVCDEPLTVSGRPTRS
jgi:glutamate racemase